MPQGATAGPRGGGGPQGPGESVLETFTRYRATGDRALRNELVEHHRWLADVVARRFANRGEPLDDLRQVALLGLVKAVDRFDPTMGSSFPSFAMPTLYGELRRHFRDTTWAVRVPRRAQELHLDAAKAVERLTHELGRSPLPAELAASLGVHLDELLAATAAGNAYRSSSLDGRLGDDQGDDGNRVAVEDRRLAGAEDRMAMSEALALLPARERRIVELRFYGEMSQSEIAHEVGVSQVHVSRLLRTSLAVLRTRLGTTRA
jgi:RNA polymerase sigma-B factor